jgi:hypothetical protein
MSIRATVRGYHSEPPCPAAESPIGFIEAGVLGDRGAAFSLRTTYASLDPHKTPGNNPVTLATSRLGSWCLENRPQRSPTH